MPVRAGPEEADPSEWLAETQGLANPVADAVSAVVRLFQEDAAYRGELLDLLFAEYEAERAR